MPHAALPLGAALGLHTVATNAPVHSAAQCPLPAVRGSGADNCLSSRSGRYLRSCSSLDMAAQNLSRPTPFDPQPDPRQEKTRRRQRSEPHTAVSRSGEKSAKRRQNRSMGFQTAIRDHEAVGSNPATRTRSPPKSHDFGGLLQLLGRF